MEDRTISSVSLGTEGEIQVPNARPYLVLLAVCDDPSVPSSRHVLDVDEVRLGRGPRSVRRFVEGETRVLELRIPDPRMSSDHGRLVAGPGGWVLDDPRSKNGSVVDGTVTRRALLDDATLIELGHSFFAFCIAPLEENAPLDRVETEVTAVPALRTFDGVLGDQFEALARVAPAPVSVVLLGETGTGKELIARALHDLSQRPGPFVAINCGALPPSLVEAELFGHRRGAFTGATGDRPGLVRSADTGTLFLDEIGELPLASQAAFLRVLQEREVTPVGGDRAVKVDVRLCAATLRDLSGLVERGEFRRDLHGRLFGFTLTLPPLRERWVDFGILLHALLARIAPDRVVRLSPPALRVLLRHDWPLNIRELEKTLVTALALARDQTIELAHLPADVRRPPPAPEATATPALAPEDAELRAKIVALLTTHDANVVAVARELGTRRTQIYRWAHRFHIDIAAYRK